MTAQFSAEVRRTTVIFSTREQTKTPTLEVAGGGGGRRKEGEGGRVGELHKIVLSTRSREQLGLDQNVRLANNWEQVAKPL